VKFYWKSSNDEMITGCTNSTVIGSYKSQLGQKKEKSRLLY